MSGTPAESGGGGGGDILGKIGGKISAAGKDFGKKAYGKIDKWATPEAKEQSSILGNVTEAGMDLYRGTFDNVGRQVMKSGEKVLDSTRAELQSVANIFHPELYRVDQIVANTAKAALETVNEGVHLATQVAFRPMETIETGLKEGLNAVDHTVHATRKLAGSIPVIGGILKVGVGLATAPVTIGTKIARLPVKGVSAAREWTEGKLEGATNKVRDFSIGGTGGHKEAPAKKAETGGHA